MKYRTFRNIAAVAGCGLVVGTGWAVKSAFSGTVAPVVSPVSDAPAPTPPEPPPTPATPAATHKLTTDEIRGMLEAWLTAHGDRNGQKELKDVLPDAPFRATAIRFRDADAGKWSDNPSQWSQIRLDLDRDGVDDEKWLLRNGHTYKREVLDPSGHTVGQPQYFAR